MSARWTCVRVALLGALATPAFAQRVSVSAHVGVQDPSGRSELFSLLDRELAPGGSALRPAIAGGEVRVRVAKRWALLAGGEAGASTVASVSRARAISSADDVRQRTTLDVSSLPYVGAEWTALRWAGAADDRLRVVLGAGGGVARYRLRQSGDFVDAQRGVAFSDAFVSSGRGAFGYASAGVEVPLRRGLALQSDVRRSWGSAPMSDDYASFDRIDLGGTRVAAGLRVTVAR